MPSRRALLRTVALVAAGLGSGCLPPGGSTTESSSLDACPDSPAIDAPGPPASPDADALVSWAKCVERAVQRETMPDDRAIGRIDRRSVDVEADPATVTLDVSLRRVETPATPPPPDSDLRVVTYRLEADRIVRIKKGHPARREIRRDCWEVGP